jgi:hypothetical protein
MKGASCMPRIYSNYSQSDYDIVIDLATELGFSPSAFQHYCVMLYADNRGNTSPISALTSKMLNNLKNIKSGDTFIVSALIPDEWPSLFRSDKMSLAKRLSHHVKTNSAVYKPHSVANGKTTIYIKK